MRCIEIRVDGQTNQRAALWLKIIQISFDLLTPAVSHSSWKSGLPAWWVGLSLKSLWPGNIRPTFGWLAHHLQRRICQHAISDKHPCNSCKWQRHSNCFFHKNNFKSSSISATGYVTRRQCVLKNMQHCRSARHWDLRRSNIRQYRITGI